MSEIATKFTQAKITVLAKTHVFHILTYTERRENEGQKRIGETNVW